MGPYKPLRNWVDEFIPSYMEMSWELIDPIAHMPEELDPFEFFTSGGCQNHIQQGSFIWSNFRDKTTDGTPQMVVKSKGNPRLFQGNRLVGELL